MVGMSGDILPWIDHLLFRVLRSRSKINLIILIIKKKKKKKEKKIISSNIPGFVILFIEMHISD
jgi:uncharacterized membrane protein YadS